MLSAAACFNVTLDEGDGIEPVTYEETFTKIPSLDALPDGNVTVPTKSGTFVELTIDTRDDGARTVTFSRDLVVFDDATSAHDLDRFGPDQIGAIRGVTLDKVEYRFDGVDTSRIEGPTLSVASARLGAGDGSFDLDDASVNDIRVDLLTPKAVVLPFAISFAVPRGQAAALGNELHVRVVLQPNLVVDASQAL